MIPLNPIVVRNGPSESVMPVLEACLRQNTAQFTARNILGKTPDKTKESYFPWIKEWNSYCDIKFESFAQLSRRIVNSDKLLMFCEERLKDRRNRQGSRARKKRRREGK